VEIRFTGTSSQKQATECTCRPSRTYPLRYAAFS
jgi:hypothetical protein